MVEFWFKWNGEKSEPIQQFGGTQAAYKTANGKIVFDEDVTKKSVTDALVKCMSCIGFAGDIFSGRWDDSKYHQEQEERQQQQNQRQQQANQNRNNQQTANQGQQQNSALAKQQEATHKKLVEQALIDINNATDPAEVKKIIKFFADTPDAEKIKQQGIAKADREGWARQPQQGQTAQ